MADLNTEQLFNLPPDQRKDIEEGMKRLKVMKRMSADFKELGMDTSQMDADIARIEQLHATITRYTKPTARNVTPKK